MQTSLEGFRRTLNLQKCSPCLISAVLEKWEMKVPFPTAVVPMTAMKISSDLKANIWSLVIMILNGRGFAKTHVCVIHLDTSRWIRGGSAHQSGIQLNGGWSTGASSPISGMARIGTDKSPPHSGSQPQQRCGIVKITEESFRNARSPGRSLAISLGLFEQAR